MALWCISVMNKFLQPFANRFHLANFWSSDRPHLQKLKSCILQSKSNPWFFAQDKACTIARLYGRNWEMKSMEKNFRFRTQTFFQFVAFIVRFWNKLDIRWLITDVFIYKKKLLISSRRTKNWTRKKNWNFRNTKNLALKYIYPSTNLKQFMFNKLLF